MTNNRENKKQKTEKNQKSAGRGALKQAPGLGGGGTQTWLFKWNGGTNRLP
jgi:hypothetical protein